jgi:hypothetical protein
MTPEEIIARVIRIWLDDLGAELTAFVAKWNAERMEGDVA